MNFNLTLTFEILFVDSDIAIPASLTCLQSATQFIFLKAVGYRLIFRYNFLYIHEVSIFKVYELETQEKRKDAAVNDRLKVTEKTSLRRR